MVKAEVLIRGLRIYKTKMKCLDMIYPDSELTSQLLFHKSSNTNELLKDSLMLIPNLNKP